ncbi:MAG TPA: hypothetical protein VIJ50_07685 [Solirubrobacteraceae bacterium]
MTLFRPQLSSLSHPLRGQGGRYALCVLVIVIASAQALATLFAPPSAEGFGVALRTAISMYPPAGAEGTAALLRVRDTGAQLVRIQVSWSTAAPVDPPPGFDAANPNDPSYNWSELDRLVQSAVGARLEPIIDITTPPAWAQEPVGGGVQRPSATQLGMFAHAAASRFNGSNPALPTVRYWEAWNEPNVSLFLEPQIQNGTPVSVSTYRTMVNDFAAGVHGARAGDVVIGGSLFPNAINRPGITAIAPLEFTRRLFCISAGSRPRRTCNTRVAVDVWSVHPYTSGGPATRPANPNNIWIANLRSFTNVVQAAQRLGSLTSRHRAQTWVTEFSWDSNPPNPGGVPVVLERRWVAETLYRSWQAGINIFTWFTLRDEPMGSSPFQSGLYFACAGGIYCDTPKPAAAAFRFPLVAYPAAKRSVYVWGRTPAGVPGSVRVQWLQGRTWRTFATLRSDGDGTFSAQLPLPRQASPGSALLRALEPGVGVSPSFSLHRPPEIAATPFGA